MQETSPRHQDFTRSFNDLFNNKGILASVAEKAVNNFNAKKKYEADLHYYAVGHSFKQIETIQVFKGVLNTETQQLAYQDYTALQLDNFKEIIAPLGKLLAQIRHNSGHYIHAVEDLKVENINPKVIQFIKESFRLAVVQSYINLQIENYKGNYNELTHEEKKNKIEKWIKNEDSIIDFFKKCFHQSLYTRDFKPKKEITPSEITEAREKWHAQKAHINATCTTLYKAVDFILFVDNDHDDFYWTLDTHGANVHRVMSIEKGMYLSFHACLFLIAMFLYKNEGSYLIPKLSGFKKNGTPEDRSKLDIFLFYAKKFSSQDIENNDKDLVYFRDIIQYLNKYPMAWNRALEQNSHNPFTDNLKATIQKWELERNFPEMVQHKDFMSFAYNYFFKPGNEDKNENPLYFDLLEYEGDIRKVYNEIIANKSNILYWQQKPIANLYKPTNYKYYVLQYLIDEYFQENSALVALVKNNGIEKKKRNFEEKFFESALVKKLKRRIDYDLLIPSYSRNDDKFLFFAVRYLTAISYFGTGVKFKMYHYYTSDEQQQAHQHLSVKELDKINFKNGKETGYYTYYSMQQNYPAWDTPFVVENNAVYIRLEGISQPICIQKDLMIYFLEDALFETERPQNRGVNLLHNYLKALNGEKTNYINILQAQDNITAKDKTKYKKLLPKRLLHSYYAPQYTGHQLTTEPSSGLRLLLDKALKQEIRYEELVRASRDNKSIDEYLAIDKRNPETLQKIRENFFRERNKGKNYKLQFIRKACHILYFRDTYLQQKENSKGHHKTHHITRDEFNDFCKWMYAFGEVKEYKGFLKKLFADKNFLTNAAFQKIFEESENLDDFYNKVKAAYGAFLATQPRSSTVKAILKNYTPILNHGVRYINVQHFKQYLVQESYVRLQEGKFRYASLANISFLIPVYYPSATGQTTKSSKDFCFDLAKIKHQDCLLYEIAMRYFNRLRPIDAKESVRNILNQHILFEQETGTHEIYRVAVPLKDVDKYRQLQNFDAGIKQNDFKILYNLPPYLHTNKEQKPLKDIYNTYIGKKPIEGLKVAGNKIKPNTISLAHLSQLFNHLINQQAKFTECIMALEAYYIWKSKAIINPPEHRISLYNIPELGDFVKSTGAAEVRNDAFHFNLPLGKSFEQVFKEIEKFFATNELKGIGYES